jgi:hypothetical protein
MLSATTEVQVGDWKCAQPEIERAKNSPATTYRFKILQAPHDMVVYTAELSATAISAATIPLTARNGEYHSYMTDFFQAFLTDFPKLFAKKHPPAAYINVLSHTFTNIVSPPDIVQPEYTVILNPVEFTIQNGKFIFVWSAELPSIDLHNESPLTVESTEAERDAVVIELSDVEDGENADKEMPIVMGSGIAVRMSDRQFRDRQRVEEARLRAKLATVRAERALERYITKYGDYESDEITSSEDGETTDGGESMN